MSKSRPAVHAAVIRSDTIETPGHEIEHRGGMRPCARIHARIYSGYQSMGYQTNYTRVPVQWFEILAVQPDSRPCRRLCWRYSGKNIDNATRDYERFLADIAERMPGATATFPTTPDPTPLHHDELEQLAALGYAVAGVHPTA